MTPIFLEYPKCTTCKKAKKWLEAHEISYESRNIVEDHPNIQELTAWHEMSGLPIKRFFNTSGILYREMNLKEKVASASQEALIQILATNGMLVKRPLLITDHGILIGFKEEEWQQMLKEIKDKK